MRLDPDGLIRSLCLAAVVLLGARSAAGQSVPLAPSIVRPVAGGVVFGFAGFFGGALIANQMVRGCEGEFCGLGEVAIGAVAGETIGLAFGVHFGDRRRGSLGVDLLGAAAVATAGIALSTGDQHDSGRALLATSIVQLATTVVLERHVGNVRERRMTFSVMPVAGRVGFGGVLKLR